MRRDGQVEVVDVIKRIDCRRVKRSLRSNEFERQILAASSAPPAANRQQSVPMPIGRSS
jgi:hypothetical protein